MTETLERLSPRERETLELLAHGKGNKEIAAELGLSLSTVKGHIESILGKLGVPSRTAAVAMWLRRSPE